MPKSQYKAFEALNPFFEVVRKGGLCDLILPLTLTLTFAVVMHSTLFQSSLLSPHAGCHDLSELLSNQKRLPLAEGAGYAERS